MRRTTLLTATALLALTGAAYAQQDVATDVTNAQVQAVLNSGQKSVDHTLKVVDLGSYQLSVAVIKRGPTGEPRPPAPPPAPARPAPPALVCRCGGRLKALPGRLQASVRGRHLA